MVLSLRTPTFRNFTFAELREDVVKILFHVSNFQLTAGTQTLPLIILRSEKYCALREKMYVCIPSLCMFRVREIPQT
mgnify:CR=1 FL=1